MTPERWREVEEIYQSAMDLAPELRRAYLAEACRDEKLRHEVESLLKLNSSPVLIDQPVWQAAPDVFSKDLLDNDSVVAAGTQLGPYRIEGVLGAGGMGQVYRARDTRLDRLVAIKVSKEEFSERFEREARAIAALNHPNICSLYDVGPNYLVMELVEGPTLAERIKRGPIPLDEALAIARQIADALNAAHERGIIHRDLKPGNIKIKADGVVKVLDFGLAKRAPAGTPPTNPEDSPTISAATSVGVILGTAAYMSPEQARGHAVDKRADIWAFGVVLYEMLTGRQLFEGTTTSDVLTAVLRDEPDWALIPQTVRRLLRSCLEKDPARRLHDIADAGLFLEAPVTGMPHPRPWISWGVAGLAILIASATFWSTRGELARRDDTPRPVVRLDVDLGPNVYLSSFGPNALLSPDGRRLVYISHSRLFTRRLDQVEAIELPGTQGARSPFFSPDGGWIGFHAGGKLKKTSVEGGAPTVICNAFAGVGASWGDDGNIIASFYGSRGLVRVPAVGGTPTPVTELDRVRGEVTHRWPQVLPGAKAVLFTAHTSARGPFDDATIEVMSLADRRRKTLHRGGTFARYISTSSTSGLILYVTRGTLFSLPFDLNRLEVSGSPTAVLQGVSHSAFSGAAQFDVSQTGTLIYKSGAETGFATLQWLDASGTLAPLATKPDGYTYPRLSPDGKRVAFATTELWVQDSQRDTRTRLTSSGRPIASPVWTPDGRIIVFADQPSIRWTWADGAGTPQVLIQGSTNRFFPWCFTPNGKTIAFSDVNEEDNYDLWTASIERDASSVRLGKREPFVQTPFQERDAAFSPDGRWLAYSSNESGTFEVYVRPFPDRGRREQISNGGGLQPVWSGSRRELLFRTEDNLIMVATYQVAADTFLSDKPRLWSPRRLVESPLLTRLFDLSSDGKRVLAIMPAEGSDDQRTHSHLTYIENLFRMSRR